MSNNYPEKFNSSELPKEQKDLLSDFFRRRIIFDNYLQEKNINLFTCPGCGYPTLGERGNYEICMICDWQDDDQDDDHADEIWGGPNSNLSLTENRLNIGLELNQIAKGKSGVINENAEEIINVLSEKNRDFNQLLSKIPDSIILDQSITSDCNSVRDDILNLLIKV